MHNSENQFKLESTVTPTAKYKIKAVIGNYNANANQTVDN